MIEPLLLTSTRIETFGAGGLLTQATGFFFARDERLYLVTSRHVMVDEAQNHRPDRLEIELHIDPDNIADTTGYSIPLYGDGRALWRQGRDTAGSVDIAAIEIDRGALPERMTYAAFTPEHLLLSGRHVEVGASLLVVGFPLGFQDTLHHMPVARRAGLASSFGLRFQGEGFFLTDARTHRGSSGAPVVMRNPDHPAADAGLPWVLLGVHSSRMDVLSRDQNLDEALGLNCAWYADILLTLTESDSA